MKVIMKQIDDLYYLGMDKSYIIYDREIAEVLKIEYKEYVQILKKYRAIEINEGQWYFKDVTDCLRCIEYLNNTYGILVALLE